jgi:hypothetical protein
MGSGGSPVFYMPHRPVLKESSMTTKIRPVFDASARGYNTFSLNDCLEAGPSLIPELLGVLIRFRRWKVAICADITKAFLQIVVCKEDRDVHRFLWNDKGVIRVMRFTRVPFGDKSSMFLLNGTIKHHLSRFPNSTVVQELKENMYVDNWISGCDDEEEGCSMTREAKAIMDQASMPLTQWGSNSAKIGTVVVCEFQDKGVEDSLKVLGLKWVSSSDCFVFEGMSFQRDLCVTKRLILGCISRLFDPLGFVAPFVMACRILFQDVWKLGLGWEELVPPEFQHRFQLWVNDLACIRGLQVPRSYTGYAWGDIKLLELHAFGDASERAFGACVYLRAQAQDGTWCVSLVLARGRVAPLKRVSLPRLELLGALFCARLLKVVFKALKLTEDTHYYCWTDSTVALAWIQSDPGRWKPFVGNRVAEIQSLTSIESWHHCPGTQNPADLLTRGLTASQFLQSDLWFGGPAFLMNGNELDKMKGVLIPEGSSSEVNVEEKQVIKGPSLLVVHSVPLQMFDVERWSSLGKALRVVGWVLRFLHNARSSKERRSGELEFEELSRAKIALLRDVQSSRFHEEKLALGQGKNVSRKSSIYKLSPTLGDDGLLRVQGRLQFASLLEDEKHPIIVPKGHLSVLLARRVHIQNSHAGVNSMLVTLRDRYWMVGARYTCKQVKRQCLSCQRQDTVAGDQTMAPLPQLRVRPAPPFAVSGVDHGGPLYCCDQPGKKLCVLLFTCAVTRALHLELVDALSWEITLLAVRRFIARRGVPSTIMSDNAKCFKAVSARQLTMLGPDGPVWKFIAPRAPWWGGWWERLMGSVKKSLKKSVGNKSLTRIELETVLLEVEGMLNSRLLTFVGDGLDSRQPLTPAHFLIGRSISCKPTVDPADSELDADGLVQRLECRTRAMEQFWNCWSKEYLRSLPPYKGPGTEDGLQEGSVVLISDEGSTRLQWPLGIVQEVYPGRDDRVRVVKVKTAKGEFIRPIQRLHHLEVSHVKDRVSVVESTFCVTVVDQIHQENSLLETL